MAFAFPELVVANLIVEEELDRAYDALKSLERAWLKTAIADLVAVYCGNSVVKKESCVSLRQGITKFTTSAPVQWTIIAWDEHYASSTCITASIIPAMLAGVPNILALRVSSQTDKCQNSILAALELAGQELVAQATPENAFEIFRQCCRLDLQGRIVLLGAAPCLFQLAKVAANMGILFRHLANPVKIGITSPDLETSALRFAHPDSAFVNATNLSDFSGISALLCTENDFRHQLGKVPLVLSPAHETFWLWQELQLDFFRIQSMGIANAC